MPIFKADHALLVAYREGRRDALERVYRHYCRTVEKYARSLARSTGSSELAQPGFIADLVQEVFIHAFSSSARRSYDGQRDFGPYLATITRNCFIDAQRARGREVLIRDEDLALMIDSSADHEEHWCDPKIAAVLGTYVSELPPAVRAIYERRFVLGQSQEEACAALSLSRRALRTGEKRLRTGLRKALVRAGISSSEYRHPIADSATKTSARPVLIRSRP
jgi:RNA polymerase sigma factor (sigma-70 family)